LKEGFIEDQLFKIHEQIDDVTKEDEGEAK